MYMNDPNDGKLAPTNNLIDDGGMGGKPGVPRMCLTRMKSIRT